MQRMLGLTLVFALLAACSHNTAPSAGVVPPVNNGGGTPPSASPSPGASPTIAPTSAPTIAPTTSPTPAATTTPFNPASVRIKQIAVPVTPLYVAAGTGHAAYFGFGANGTGSALYRYENGAFVQTMPAAPPSGDSSGGGVYGIAFTAGRVFWLSSYFDSSDALNVNPECGGAGGTATLCERTVDEPTSMLIDKNGVFWIAGLSFNGGGEVATSSNASTAFNSAEVMQILNGPKQAVWGVLADFSKNPTLYSVVQFVVSGSSIGVVRSYALPSGDSIGSMTVGGDGNFWFTDSSRNAIGRMDASGSLQEFPLRTPNALPSPWYGEWQIATACDGSVWFTEPGPNKIGRINRNGAIAEVPLPTSGAQPVPIAATPGSAAQCSPPELWVGEEHASALAAISF